MNKNLRRLAEPNTRFHVIVLLAFAAATAFFRMYQLAAAEAGVILLLLIYSAVVKRRKKKQLEEYIETLTYDTENAKNNTLMNFPLGIAVFRLEDTRIVWGNDNFFALCGKEGTRLDARMTDVINGFSVKWLMDGQARYPGLLEINERKYELHGSLIRSDKKDEASAYMGIAYLVDMTDFDRMRTEYRNSRPVAGIVIIDNLEELYKNQSDRMRNDIRDAIEDRLVQWVTDINGIIKRYDRDRYILIFENRYMESLIERKFAIVQEMHAVTNTNGIQASISMGLGVEARDLPEALQFAGVASELALSRGGDQTVVKNRMSFDFYGGRGAEVEKRTKIKSRVMANALAELICDSSLVIAMGHRNADLDAVGAAVAVCCLARKCGVEAKIAIDEENCFAKPLIERLKADELYKNAFISTQDAMIAANGSSLLVVVDVNNPNQVEDEDLLLSCNRVAVIDHHRVSAAYIQHSALNFVEPYASSACELMAEILEEAADLGDIRRSEAEAMMAGIVLDTKNFTLRTGDRTFDAASYLRKAGADPVVVKKLLQNGMEDTVTKYTILQKAELYRGVAIAAPEGVYSRILAAQSADELLNISGVDASVVLVADGNGGVNLSARSIGETNMQILMEKLGGGGNRSAAAAHMDSMSVAEAAQRLREALDEYLSN